MNASALVCALALALVPIDARRIAIVVDASADGANAQGGEPIKVPKCIKCHDLGRRPCPEHPAAECEWELKSIYCTEIASCATCGGVGWIDCPDCSDPTTEQWLEARRAKVAGRKAGLKFIDDAMKRDVRKGESDHCVIVWEAGELKVDKKRMAPHELTHVFLERMEALYADFKARLQVTDTLFSAKCELYLWSLPADHQTCGTALCAETVRGGIKLLGVHPRYSLLVNRTLFPSDEKLHRNLVHSVTHLLLSNVAPAAWVGNVRGGWMDEGLAHFFEDRYWGICDNYCFQEQNTNVDFKGGKYRLAVRRMVADDKLPSVAEVFEQNVDTLTLPMHAVSMSYVDYLLQKDGAKFYELTKRLKKKQPSGDALREVFGMRPLEFEANWKAFVLATYPTR